MAALSLTCAWLLGAGLAAAPTLQLEVGLQAEERVRTLTLPGEPAVQALETELAPWLQLGLTLPALELVAAYRPLLNLTDRGGGQEALLHQASLLGRWRPEPRWQATGTLDWREGTISLLQLLAGDGAAGTPAQPVPGVASIGYRSLQGTAGLRVDTGPRHRLQLSLAGAMEGGADLADQRALPFQHRLQAVADLEWDAGHRDVLAARLDATVADFSSGDGVGIGLLTGTWRRALTEALRFWLGAGAAVTGLLPEGAGTPTTQVGPQGEVGAGYDGRPGGLALQGTLAATVAPFIDRLTGAVPQRLAFTAGLKLTPSPPWLLEAGATGGWVLDGPQRDDRVWGGSLQLRRQLGEYLEAAVGVRGLVQDQPRAFARTIDWNAFLSLAVHSRRRTPAPPAPPEEPLAPEVAPADGARTPTRANP